MFDISIQKSMLKRSQSLLKKNISKMNSVFLYSFCIVLLSRYNKVIKKFVAFGKYFEN